MVMMNRLIIIVFFPMILLSCFCRSAEAESDLYHPLDIHLSEVETGDLPHMIKKRYLRVLITMNGTNFFLDGVKPHGFEYSLLKEYEKFLNKGIGTKELRLTLEFIPVPRDRLLNDLAAGYGDIAAAGLTITPLREKYIDFTLPYLANISELLVTHKDLKSIESLEDLSGKELFVRESSSYFASITALNKRFIEKKKQPVKIIPADENLETEDILELINSGAIEMTVCDSHLADIWAKVLPDIRVHKNIAFRQGGKIAWAVRENNPQLKKSLDEFIKEHRKGTLLGNIFFNRYYKNMEWVKNPLKGQYSKRIEKYRPVFEKYSDKYGFDWRLILAMSFQESGLNHERKSNRGAIGLMQIKPSTASDPNVGINKVNELENNVHAAVKYLDFIRDRYFSDQEILPRDQVRFSMAAYNAGPAKISQARKKAEEMKLDPNSWFRNVELAVLRIVGQETVRYVSNINKYYVIYKTALDIKESKKLVKDEI
jgi:membrane-bound lytic murein transglycosylase MltF